MKKKLNLFVFFILMAACAAGQGGDELLRSRLQGKTQLKDIMPIVENYYKDPTTISRLGATDASRRLRKWKRWEMYHSTRLDANGNFVNVSQRLLEWARNNPREVNMEREYQTESSSGAWTFIGPNETSGGGLGRTDRVVFHPTDPDIIYVGSPGGGIWRTQTGGTFWHCLSERLPSMGVSGIVLNPQNPSEIFILTGDGNSDTGGLVDAFGYIRFSAGVFRCTDAGVSGNWEQLGSFPGVSSTLVGYQLVMDPNNPLIMLAATSEGLFRTTNGGNSWTLELAGRIYDVAFKPGSSTVCYAVTSSQFFRSVNGGLDWTNDPNTDALTAGTSRIKMAVSSANANYVYLLLGGGNTPGQFNGFLRSTTSGASFTVRSTDPGILGNASDGTGPPSQVTFNLSVAIDPTNINRVIIGAIQAWRSDNGGVDWVFKGSGVHDDIHDLAISPLTGDLWAASDGGMYSSADAGDNWVDRTFDLPTSMAYRMAVSPVDVNDILIGTQDNGLKFRNGATQNFEHMRQTDGYVPAFDPGDATIFYCTMNANIWKFDYDLDVITLINPNPGITGLSFFSNLATHPFNANTIYLAEDSFWRSTNGGTSWNFVPNVDGGWYLRSCPSNSNRIYMAGGDTWNSPTGLLRRSDDGGLSFPGSLVLSENPGFPENFPKITSINVNPTNSNQVYVTFGGFTDGIKVFYSADAGGEWEDISYSLPNVPVNTIAIDNSNNAYVGTDVGVFYKGASMNDWIPFYNNLPYVAVTDLVISQSSNLIRASTFGRGVWQSDLHSACVANLTLNINMGGQKYYEASNTISSAGMLLPDAGTKVAMQAGNQVTFSPPFLAPSGTQLKAYTGPCGSGGIPQFRMTDSTQQLPFRSLIIPNDGVSVAPYATIEVINNGVGAPSIKINAKKAGTVQYVITKPDGEVIRKSGSWNPGMGTEINTGITGPALAPGLYYVHVIHEGRWVHFQELNIQ